MPVDWWPIRAASPIHNNKLALEAVVFYARASDGCLEVVVAAAVVIPRFDFAVDNSINCGSRSVNEQS